jgi:tripartite-type tricarboxylate transporter receptor subunit TctC
MNRRRFLQLSGSAPFLPLLGAPFSMAEEAWPSRTISIVTGVAAGGQVDMAARPVAQALSQVLGKAVVVENRVGAGGALGASYVAKAEPDGHTMFMALSAAAVLPEAERIAGRTPLYEMSDFVPVARVVSDPNLLAVSASSPYKSVQDLVKDAKARPGEIAYGSSGNYGGIHLSLEMLAQAAGVKFLHVPFRGGAPALTALMGNQVSMIALGAGPLKSYSDAGQLRILATYGTERHPAFPDAPTFAELGYDSVVFTAWVGLFLPKSVPAAVVARTRDAMRQVMTDPATLAIYTKAGAAPAYQDQPEFAAYVAADTDRLVKTVRVIGKLE